MSTPVLSIITPCYNQAHLLGQCIDSVLALQCMDKIQIVVVNDGSPDNTAEVARAYGDQIQYVEQANAGLPGARNAGIAAATGEYLMFLDADDLAHPELAQFVAEPRSADAYPGNYVIERSWSRESTRHAVGLPEGAVAIYNHNIGPPLCCIVKRSLAQQIDGFDREFKSCEDWDFWIRVWKQEPSVQALDIAYGVYKLYETSMASAYDRMWKSARQVWAKHSHLARLGGAWSQTRRKNNFYVSTLHERLVWAYLKSDKRGVRINLLGGVLLQSPATFTFFGRRQLSKRITGIFGRS